MSKCTIIIMLLTQVKPSDLKGLRKVTKTHGRESKIPIYVWSLGRLSSMIPSALTLFSAYQKVFIMFISNSVSLNLVVMFISNSVPKTEESFQSSPTRFQIPSVSHAGMSDVSPENLEQVAAKQSLMSQKKTPAYDISAP